MLKFHHSIRFTSLIFIGLALSACGDNTGVGVDLSGETANGFSVVDGVIIEEPSSNDEPELVDPPVAVVGDEIEPQPGQPPTGNPTIPPSRPIVTPTPLPPPLVIPDFENPIEREVFRLTNGQYQMSYHQRRLMDQAEKPDVVAERLERRVLSLRQRGAEALQIPIRFITIFDVLPSMDFRWGTTSYGPMSDKSFLDRIGGERSFDLGQRVGEYHIQAGIPLRNFPRPTPEIIIPEIEDSPIVAEVNRLTNGEYALTVSQQRQIRRATDPEGVASGLASRLRSYRQRGSEALGIRFEHLTRVFVFPGINLTTTATRYGNIQRGSYLQAIGDDRAYEAGYRVGTGEWD